MTGHNTPASGRRLPFLTLRDLVQRLTMERLSQEAQVSVLPRTPAELDMPGQDNFGGTSGMLPSSMSSVDPVNVEQAMELLRMGAFRVGTRSEAAQSNHPNLNLNGGGDLTAANSPPRTNFNLESTKHLDISPPLHHAPSSATSASSVHPDPQTQVTGSLPSPEVSPATQKQQSNFGSVAFPGMPPPAPPPSSKPSENPNAVFNPMRAAAAAATAMATNPAMLAALAAHVHAQQSALSGVVSPSDSSNTMNSGAVAEAYGSPLSSPMWGRCRKSFCSRYWSSVLYYSFEKFARLSQLLCLPLLGKPSRQWLLKLCLYSVCVKDLSQVNLKFRLCESGGFKSANMAVHSLCFGFVPDIPSTSWPSCCTL